MTSINFSPNSDFGKQNSKAKVDAPKTAREYAERQLKVNRKNLTQKYNERAQAWSNSVTNDPNNAANNPPQLNFDELG